MKLLLILLMCACSALAFIKPETRIFKGQKAKAGQFPYHVGIYIKANKPGSGRCGGALVQKNAVVTAAHCLTELVAGKISVGSTEYAKGTLADIKSVIIHPDYDEETDENDIAIIVLGSNITPDGKDISFIEISGDKLTDNESVTISGYGGVGNGDPSNSLLYTNLRTISQNVCKRAFGVSETAICCLGDDKQSTCEGDSGGPLVKYDSKGKAVLVGVVSFGSETCEAGYPAVFTRLSAYKDWVLKELAKL